MERTHCHKENDENVVTLTRRCYTSFALNEPDPVNPVFFDIRFIP